MDYPVSVKGRSPGTRSFRMRTHSLSFLEETQIPDSGQTHPGLWLHDDDLLVLLGHQHAGGERRLDHVDDQVVGQNIQLLHLVARHIGAACDAVTDEIQKIKRKQTVRVKTGDWQ